MTRFVKWFGVAMLCVGVSSTALAGEDGTDPAAQLDDVLATLSADAESSFDALFEAVGDDKVTTDAGGYEIVMSGSGLWGQDSDGSEFSVTSRGAVGVNAAVYEQGSGGYDTNGIIIIEELGFVVIYWNNYVIILY